MKRTKLAAAIAILLASVSSTALAAPVTFFGEDLNGPPNNDPNALATHPNADAARTIFLTNLTGVGTEDFESLSGSPPIALTFPGAGTATLTGGVGIASGNDGAGRYPISGNNYYSSGTDNFNVAFGAPVAAFGFYGVDIGDYGGTLTLSLTDTSNNVSLLNVPLTLGVGGNISGSVLFFGFYDTANQYTNIAFTTFGGVDIFGFDDMTVGSAQQVTPTPEPGSMALFAAGLLGMGLAWRRRNA